MQKRSSQLKKQIKQLQKEGICNFITSVLVITIIFITFIQFSFFFNLFMRATSACNLSNDKLLSIGIQTHTGFISHKLSVIVLIGHDICSTTYKSYLLLTLIITNFPSYQIHQINNQRQNLLPMARKRLFFFDFWGSPLVNVSL